VTQQLAGKKALVTGGTKGIGLAIATALNEAGAEVTVTGRTPTKGLEPIHSVVCDVRNRSDLERLRDDLESLDILVANAGTNKRVEMLDLDEQSLRDIVETNFFGVFEACQVFGPLLLAKPGSRVIVTSSVSAIHGQKLRVAYCGTKAGLDGMVRALAVEWGPKGCTVNAIAPGVTRTPLTEAYMAQYPERVEAAIQHTPLRRLAEPDDMSGVAVFLASDAARFVTGQTIFVDGGMTAGSDWW
jgi:NAD(P)-dependent dehydrogenase (short-subunit alcohol dehydrogenase family)